MSIKRPKCSSATFGVVANLLKESQDLANSYISKLNCSLDPVQAKGYIYRHGILRPFQGKYVPGNNDTGTCPQALKTIKFNTWSKLPIGKAMNKQTFCGLATIDKPDKQQLALLGKELIETAAQIYKKIQKLYKKNASHAHKYGKGSAKIKKQLQTYKYLLQKLEKLEATGHGSTLGGQLEDARMRQTSGQYSFFVWFFLAAIAGTFAFRHFTISKSKK